MQSGYIWNEYKETIIKYNADQIYRQATIDIQQGKEPDISNDIYQNIIKRQQNSKLNINGDKISGDVDLTLIGINNEAKAQGMYYFDHNAKAEFVAEIDDKTTPMCKSLNNQIFNVHGWNEFIRYSATNGRMTKYRCYGLIPGLNLPPIDDHFHWCRSTIKYIKSVPNVKNKWYNKLGNGSNTGKGGTGKGTFIEKISQDQIQQKLKEYEDDIRNRQTEYGILIDKDGNVYAYAGDETNLTVSDRSMAGAIFTHNHPDVCSFGEDDFNTLKDNQLIKELRAVDRKYNYTLKLLKPLDISYSELWKKSADIMVTTGEEQQHCAMMKLKEMGYIEYDRTRKK